MTPAPRPTTPRRSSIVWVACWALLTIAVALFGGKRPELHASDARPTASSLRRAADTATRREDGAQAQKRALDGDTAGDVPDASAAPRTKRRRLPRAHLLAAPTASPRLAPHRFERANLPEPRGPPGGPRSARSSLRRSAS